MKEIKSLKDIQERFKEISKKRFYRMALLCDYAIYKKDGSKTLFAERFNVSNYKDLYNFFKNVKTKLKNDNEDEAFFMIGELIKSVNGRVAYFIKSQFNVPSLYKALYIASIFNIRTIGFILDNLIELKQVFDMLEEYHKANKSGSISKEASKEVTLEKEDEEDIIEKSEKEDYEIVNFYGELIKIKKHKN